MEYLFEFNSFFKKFKKAIADQNVEVNPDDVLYDIESSISFIKDMGGFNVKSRKDKGLTYRGNNGVVTLPYEKDFFYLSISSNVNGGNGVIEEDEFVGFNIDLIKEDLIGCIDYIRNKYPVSYLKIGAALPKKKVLHHNTFGGGNTNDWLTQNSKSVYLTIEDIKNMEDFDIYSISIFFVI